MNIGNQYAVNYILYQGVAARVWSDENEVGNLRSSDKSVICVAMVTIAILRFSDNNLRALNAIEICIRIYVY